MVVLDPFFLRSDAVFCGMADESLSVNESKKTVEELKALDEEMTRPRLGNYPDRDLVLTEDVTIQAGDVIEFGDLYLVLVLETPTETAILWRMTDPVDYTCRKKEGLREIMKHHHFAVHDDPLDLLE